MSRPEPKFQVGEEVIVCSKSCPLINGDAIIASAQFEIATGVYSGWAYTINRSIPAEYLSERIIFKKHKPSDQSFDQLMQSLNKERVA